MRQGNSKFSMLTQNYTQIGTKSFFPIRKKNISNFFRSDEILECIAGWKEGSSRYLVGRLQPLSQSSSSLRSIATSVVPSVTISILSFKEMC